MGLTFRKSISAGPFRFNLSGSGIGMSVGVRGFRVGTGPRGNYVHMGAGGVYYRQSLPSGSPGPSVTRPSESPSATGGLQAIESADVSSMTDASAATLLEELQTKRQRFPWWPITAAVAGLLLLGAGGILGAAPLVVIAIVGGVSVWMTYQRDTVARTTVIMYDLEAAALERYEELHAAFDDFARCGRVGHVSAQGRTDDWKRHAGAQVIQQRSIVRPHKTAPPGVRTNVDVPALPVGRQTLHFFPDRLLVFDRAGIGAVPYRDLQITVGTSRFIEGEGVPGDAQVVGRTWKFPNKNGGPDRRFSDNPELPIALYEEIHFHSTSGLNELIQVSRVGVGDFLRTALAKQADSLSSTRESQVGVR
jgi:hypothetical protein